jgi:pSer/pThr/pTyr-binding forkhead associated (FHA) protein
LGELSDITIAAIKFGFLAVLWLFVLTAVSVMRSDLFGTRVTPKAPPATAMPPRAAGPAKPARSAKPAKPRRGAPGSLVVTSGGLAGTAIRLGETPVTLGRAQDSTLVLNDDYASTRHARLFPQDGQWFVEDLNSTNGTYLDRSKVTSPTPVPIGVPIRIGKTVVELRK